MAKEKTSKNVKNGTRLNVYDSDASKDFEPTSSKLMGYGAKTAPSKKQQTSQKMTSAPKNKNIIRRRPPTQNTAKLRAFQKIEKPFIYLLILMLTAFVLYLFTVSGAITGEVNSRSISERIAVLEDNMDRLIIIENDLKKVTPLPDEVAGLDGKVERLKASLSLQMEDLKQKIPGKGNGPSQTDEPVFTRKKAGNKTTASSGFKSYVDNALKDSKGKAGGSIEKKGEKIGEKTGAKGKANAGAEQTVSSDTRKTNSAKSDLDIKLPERSPQLHMVRPKETLFSISKEYGITVDALLKMNNLKKGATIYPGQRLIVKP